jgi:hypothetical protein
MGFFAKGPDPIEREKALNCLRLWQNTINSIDEAANAMRATIAANPMGMQSDEFERARLVAVSAVKKAQEKTGDFRRWPSLNDSNGLKILAELIKDLNESYQHQMNLLNLYKIAAQAFRIGDERSAPSSKEMKRANESFGRLLDKMGRTASKMARHYEISPQEVLRG